MLSIKIKLSIQTFNFRIINFNSSLPLVAPHGKVQEHKVQVRGAQEEQRGAPKEQHGAPEEQHGALEEQHGAPEEQHGALEEQHGAQEEHRHGRHGERRQSGRMGWRQRHGEGEGENGQRCYQQPGGATKGKELLKFIILKLNV